MRRVLAAVVVALCAAVARAGWWDDAGAAKRTTLDVLRRDPGLWLDVTVAVDVRLAGVVDAGDPCATRFMPRDWRAVAAFPAESAPDAAAWKKPMTSIFVRRGSTAERRLASAAKEARVQLRGAVRDSVRGEPWIEVFEATADGDPLTPEESALVARADEFLAHDNAAAAEPLYRGLAGKRALPTAVRAQLWRKIGASCWALRRVAAAVDAYAASLAADPADAGTAERLAAARAALAAQTPVAAAPARRLLPPVGAEVRPSTPVPTSTPVADAPASKPAAPAAEESTPAPKPRLSGPK